MVKPIGPDCNSFNLEFFDADGTPVGSYSGDLMGTPKITTRRWRDEVFDGRAGAFGSELDPPTWWRDIYTMSLCFLRSFPAGEDYDFDPDGYWLH